MGGVVYFAMEIKWNKGYQCDIVYVFVEKNGETIRAKQQETNDYA